MPERGPLVIVGAGGFGREVWAVVQSAVPGLDTVFVDDAPPDDDRLRRIGARWVGDIDSVTGLDRFYVIGIGNPGTRRLIDERLDAGGARSAPALVAPDAWCGPDVDIGDGSVVCSGARVTTNVRIGRHVHLNLNVTIGHDVVIGDHVTVAPLTAVSGQVTLGPGVELGTGVSVLPGLHIGEGAVVGAGAVVTRDVPDHITVVGTPARPR